MKHLLLLPSSRLITLVLLFLNTPSTTSIPLIKTKKTIRKSSLSSSSSILPLIHRGGSTAPQSSNIVQNYLLEQHHLHTLRSILLTEYLSSRDIPLHTLKSIQTPADATKPPQDTDWDCALSTSETPRSCLYSFEAQEGSKVVSPIGTEDQWITLGALVRLRRIDPSKVQPMWNDKYAILTSWFDEGDYSLMQHLGLKGFIVSHILLDNPIVLKTLTILAFLVVSWISMPVWSFALNRILVSGQFWGAWNSWSKVVHAAFPLKLVVAQFAWKFGAGKFEELVGWMRGLIIDWECRIFEEMVPITVGGVEEESEEIIEEVNFEEEETEFDYDQYDE